MKKVLKKKTMKEVVDKKLEENSLENWNEVIQKHTKGEVFREPVKLIHIEELFTAFQKFQVAQRHGISSIREPNKWQKAMDEAREQFKTDIGDLANYIDWTDKSEA